MSQVLAKESRGSSILGSFSSQKYWWNHHWRSFHSTEIGTFIRRTDQNRLSLQIHTGKALFHLNLPSFHLNLPLFYLLLRFIYLEFTLDWTQFTLTSPFLQLILPLTQLNLPSSNFLFLVAWFWNSKKSKNASWFPNVDWIPSRRDQSTNEINLWSTNTTRWRCFWNLTNCHSLFRWDRSHRFPSNPFIISSHFHPEFHLNSNRFTPILYSFPQTFTLNLKSFTPDWKSFTLIHESFTPSLKHFTPIYPQFWPNLPSEQRIYIHFQEHIWQLQSVASGWSDVLLLIWLRLSAGCDHNALSLFRPQSNINFVFWPWRKN